MKMWVVCWPSEILLTVHFLCDLYSLIPNTFDSVQSAQRAKASLNGADIYSGCCTLKIEYAKVSARVKVTVRPCPRSHLTLQAVTVLVLVLSCDVTHAAFLLCSQHASMFSRTIRTHGITPTQLWAAKVKQTATLGQYWHYPAPILPLWRTSGLLGRVGLVRWQTSGVVNIIKYCSLYSSPVFWLSLGTCLYIHSYTLCF